MKTEESEEPHSSESQSKILFLSSPTSSEKSAPLALGSKVVKTEESETDKIAALKKRNLKQIGKECAELFKNAR